MAIDLGDIPSGTPPTAGEKLQIRSAIGVGTTDAPTFAGLDLTGNITKSAASTLTISSASGQNLALNVGGGGGLSSNGGLSLTSGSFLGRNSICSLYLTSGGQMGFGPTSDNTGTNDASLFRDAAGILAQRNGTSAQAFRVYNTYPGTTADEWGAFDFKTNAGTLTIGTQRLSTGGLRNVSIVATGATIQMAPGNTNTWKFDGTTGSFLANSDNTYDIGASGANRPRDLYVAGQFYLGGVVRTSGGIKWNVGGTVFIESSNGVVSLQSSSGSDFGRLQLGGTADTHPAIARDGAGIKFTGAAAGSTSWIKVPAVAIASLPSAATAGVGARAFVNDALTPVFGSAVANGGSATVPVYSTGSAWNVG